MYFFVFSLLLGIVLGLIQIKFKLAELAKENASLKQTLDTQAQTIEKISDTIQIKQVPNKQESKLVYSYEQNNQQHFYIVREILKNKSNNAFISSKEYEFANEDLYTSKTEARLFYDNKVANSSYINKNSVLEYELYIVNNLFHVTQIRNSLGDVSMDGAKRYLLINNEGKEQIDGRNFEFFALRQASDKMSKKPDTKASFIGTKNSFLDGDYKD